MVNSFKANYLAWVLVFIMFFALVILPANVVNADNNESGTDSSAASGECASGGGFFSFPTWYEYLEYEYLDGSQEGEIEGCSLTLPTDKDGNTDVGATAGRVLLAVFEIILRIAGLVAVAMVIFGGFKYMLSQGEPEATKGARTTIINALIGLGIAVSGTIIINIVAGAILS
ncbi:MAG: hypothetical protein U5K77_01745 [Candidatus Saccharibacteria bacterium]|nr:hypothetical protein [Candidatus Saccharibacteria bacterium]